MNATLVYSTKWFPKSRTLVSWEPKQDSFSKLMSSIFADVSAKTNLRVDGNKYFYKPSNDYKEYLIRFKGIRK
jgi:hypothetical protein